MLLGRPPYFGHEDAVVANITFPVTLRVAVRGAALLSRRVSKVRARGRGTRDAHVVANQHFWIRATASPSIGPVHDLQRPILRARTDKNRNKNFILRTHVRCFGPIAHEIVCRIVKSHLSIQGILLEIRQQLGRPAGAVGIQARHREQRTAHSKVSVHRDAHLLQVILTLHAAGSFHDLLYRRQQEANQHGHDGDDDQ